MIGMMGTWQKLNDVSISSFEHLFLRVVIRCQHLMLANEANSNTQRLVENMVVPATAVSMQYAQPLWSDLMSGLDQS